MLSKEEIEKAKKITKNYIKDTPVAPYECLMNEERKAAIVLLEYIEQLEKELETYKDIKSIANTKMTELTQIKDIDKLKSENWILQNKLNKYESREQKLIEKLEERIKAVDKCYNELLTDVGGIKIINVTGLTKKEKEEIINKRNCLLVQKYCYEEILEILKKE